MVDTIHLYTDTMEHKARTNKHELTIVLLIVFAILLLILSIALAIYSAGFSQLPLNFTNEPDAILSSMAVVIKIVAAAGSILSLLSSIALVLIALHFKGSDKQRAADIPAVVEPSLHQTLRSELQRYLVPMQTFLSPVKIQIMPLIEGEGLSAGVFRDVCFAEQCSRLVFGYSEACAQAIDEGFALLAKAGFD